MMDWLRRILGLAIEQQQGRWQPPMAEQPDNPGELDRILGNVSQYNASKAFEFTPEFNEALSSTMPRKVDPGFSDYYPSIDPAHEGEYWPDANQGSEQMPGKILLNKNTSADDSEVVRHEGLHAVNARNSPEERAKFDRLLEDVLDPKAKDKLARFMQPYGYGGERLSDETHSYLPELAQMLGDNSDFGPGNGLPMELKEYYSQYFNPEAKQPNPYRIAAQVGMPIPQLIEQALHTRKKPKKKIGNKEIVAGALQAIR